MQDYDTIRNRELDQYLTRFDPMSNKEEKQRKYARDDAIEHVLSYGDNVAEIIDSSHYGEMLCRIAAIMTCDRDSVPEHIDAMRETAIKALADKIEAKTEELLKSGMY